MTNARIIADSAGEATVLDVTAGTAAASKAVVLDGSKNIATLGTITAASLDISGAIDVDGTTNLDVVDIDGAVNMATTALVTGVLTTTATAVFNGGFTSNDGVTISTADVNPQLTIISTEAGGDQAPLIDLYRNSSTPADGDVLGQLRYYGENSADEKIEYVRVRAGIADVTDGDEGSTYTITSYTAGAQYGRLNIQETATIFNENSADIDFRVESNGNTHMLFVDGGTDRIGINESSPTTQLQITGATNTGGTISLKRPNTTVTAGQTLGGIEFLTADSGSAGIAARILGEGDGTGGEARLVFATGTGGSASERMRIHSNGVASFNNGVALGVGTANTASNVLDDYEEGTWDPAASFNDDGATGHGGKYTKIGNVVTATFSITFGSTSYGAVISILNLPFSATTQSGLGIGGAMIKGYYDGSSTNLSGYVGDNSSQIDLYENQTQLTHNSDKILGKNIRGTVVYHVN